MKPTFDKTIAPRAPIVTIAAIAAIATSVLSPTHSAAQAVAPPAMAEYKDMQWVDTSTPAGAKQAQLWGDAKAADQGMMLRWKFNSRLRDQTRLQDARYIVLAGTFTVEIAGNYREFGPGGYVFIPKGVKHTIGCEASGDCRLFVHQSSGAETPKPTP
jgi:mannose-6-phosphate isomerase-like protein (cupin superfamily)